MHASECYLVFLGRIITESSVRMNLLSVMAILLFGLSAISVLVGCQPAVASVKAANTNASVPGNDVYVPYQGERFDVFDWSLCKVIWKY